jgi:hypothetical protein
MEGWGIDMPIDIWVAFIIHTICKPFHGKHTFMDFNIQIAEQWEVILSSVY